MKKPFIEAKHYTQNAEQTYTFTQTKKQAAEVAATTSQLPLMSQPVFDGTKSSFISLVV